MLFTELGLPEEISRAAAEAGYTEATSIQAEAIPVLLSGRDLVACSQTGTGKTAAFAMPLLAKIDLDKKTPQLVVLAPTRELAIQVAEAFEQYGSQLKKLRVLSVFGGAAYQPQLSALHRGVHVVVGTPGRLIDHVKSGALDLSSISSLVLDEADELIVQTRQRFPDKMQDSEINETIARASAEVDYRLAEKVAVRADYREKRGEYGAARLYYEELLAEHDKTPFAEKARDRLTAVENKPAIPEKRLAFLTKVFPEGRRAKPLVTSESTSMFR